MIPSRVLAPLALLFLAGAAPAPVLQEGLNLNTFVQEGDVAAHVLLRSGTDPRLIVAFPAGNSGVGLWFGRIAKPAQWAITTPPVPIHEADAQGRPLRGVRLSARIAALRLDLKQAVLSSVRVLRDYQALGTAPQEVLVAPTIAGQSVVWQRDRLDGKAGYRLALTVTHGRLVDGAIVAGADGRIAVAITALSGDPALTPYTSQTLLTPQAAADPAARRALQFLSYHEKFLAGSWRFNTYFGRDTLMSVRLLMPVLTPPAVETGLRSVLTRLSADGNVAHEEDIGEFAVLDHLKAGEGPSDAPTYNYAMIDSAFLLAPVARAWLVDDQRGAARAGTFLAERDGDKALGAALMANLRHVAQAADAFARDPRWQHLIALKPGMDAGEWRDSNDGLGGGRYPYDVNAVLVPAALDAAAAMARAGLLDAYATPQDRAMLARLPQMAKVWHEAAPRLFLQSVPAATARAQVGAYAKAEGVPATPALAALGNQPLRYHAIALDGAGQPVPILHSDEGFALLMGSPDADQVMLAADTMARPFPAGLMTGAGMVVADPALAPPALQARFGRNAYHGTVVWSWHQALAAAGLARQAARADLPAPVCARVRTAQAALWRGIDASRAVQSSELWSWSYAGGRYKVEAFGARGGDADESNAAQLWSTVYLALKRPAPGVNGCGQR
ncbi:hypothetical protein [Novosphingobium sp. SG720]|uniref:hypothetical protein n=1 Tax=Novosphingobium sp. SG720 TaxID=2586998 RepID=UPI0014480885|nr:hypothetical protein [Novosphingobium sp. SG720]NKJ44367.1 glycogen debranching enzyme [Novosphingobium sp. SG720]